jgi:hypothetical protein
MLVDGWKASKSSVFVLLSSLPSFLPFFSIFSLTYHLQVHIQGSVYAYDAFDLTIGYGGSGFGVTASGTSEIGVSIHRSPYSNEIILPVCSDFYLLRWNSLQPFQQQGYILLLLGV